jgi:transposase
LSTKIHAGCRDERTSVAIVLTAGQCHESPTFETVFAQLPPEPPLTHAVMDKGYDSNSIRASLVAQDIVPVIPSKSNRTAPIDYDQDVYKLREKVERFFNHLKQFRRIATRYDKLSQTFLAFIHLVAACIMIK